MERSSGILLHISSLPSDYGIGTLGKPAYDFVDFLKKAKQRYWQILPFGPTGYADSPYQSFSAFAGNPYFIDLDMLGQKGLLTDAELSDAVVERDGPVDYGRLFETRFLTLERAFSRGFSPGSDGYLEFMEKNRDWIYDYSFFMALKDHYNHLRFTEWPLDIRTRQPDAMRTLGILLEERINFYRYLQYLFFEQFEALKGYAQKNDLRIMGDIPIYPSPDSSDVWAWPQDYVLDEERRPKAVAGVPPDYFSQNGQLWGNPLYNWEQIKRDGYRWWQLRLAQLDRLLDAVRIDHFRGFYNYYSIPFGEKTAKNGRWEQGPGMEFVDMLKREFPRLLLVAEDLGDLDSGAAEFVEATGLPGMRVLQFAFDAENSPYLPHNHIKNTVVYTGTHDNNTLNGWLSKRTKSTAAATKYLGLNAGEGEVFGVMRAGMSSVAKLFIAPIQDYLMLPESCRMNEPSTVEGNWRFRVKREWLGDDLAKTIAELTARYGRAT